MNTATKINHEDSVAFEAMRNIGALKTIHPVLAQLEMCVRHNVVPFMEGPPGSAKSMLAYEFADQTNRDIIELRPALEDLSGIKGLPNFQVIEGDTVVGWAVPALFPRDPDWKGIFFIDEVVKAAPSIQGALSQLVLDRRIGDYTLPKGAVIILAGNRTKDRAAAFKMPTDLANRVSRLPVDFHVKAWTSWAKGKIPDVAIAFANYRTGLLTGFDSREDVNCTARTFTMAASLVEEEDSATALTIAQGLMGSGQAMEYFGFFNHWNAVPSLDAVMRRGDTLAVPSEPDVQYATLAKLSESLNHSNADKLNVYVERFPRESQAVFWRSALLRDAALAANGTFAEWLMDNQEYLI